MNKFAIISVIFILLTIFCGGAFASNPTWENGHLEITPNIGNELSDFTVDLTNFDGVDMNQLCLGTDNTNTNATICLNSDGNFSTTLNLFNNSDNLTEGDYNLHAFIKNNDGNYSEKYSSTFDLNIDQTDPTVNLFGVVDGMYYDINNFTIDINSPSTDLNYLWATYDEDTNYDTSELSYSLTNLTDGKYSITYDGNDHADNNFGSTTVTFYVDTTTPSISSLTTNHTTKYTSDTNPQITFNLNKDSIYFNSGKMYFSCNNIDWEVYSFSNNSENFNVLTGAGCNANSGDKNIYTIVTDNLDRNSSYAVTNYYFDNVAPSPPQNLTATAGDGQVTLNWEAPTSADNNSGKRANPYQIRVSPSGNITTTSELTATINLTNETTYTFYLSVFDGAENESTEESVTATPQKNICGCTLKINNTTSTIYANDNTLLNIECTFDEEVSDPKIKFKYEGETVETLTEINDDTEIDDDLTIDLDTYSNSRYIRIYCYGNGEYLKDTKVYLDNISPNLNWNDTNNIFSESRIISFDVNDEDLIESVKLYLDSDQLSISNDSEKYSIDFNSKKYPNGTHTLKATAIDRSGNKTEKIRNITIQNAISEENEKLNLLNLALTKKKVVEGLIEYLEGQGVLISQSIIDSKAVADGLVTDANALTDLVAIKAKTDEAILVYDQINSNLPTGVEIISAKNYEYSLEGLVDTLIGLGIDPATAQKAKDTIQATNANRTIEIIKVDQNYQARIKITFTNDTNDTTVKIVEIIPKEFAKSAALLHSSHPFVIIEDDPIIEFTIDAPIGSEIEISYGIANLSEESANELIDNNVIANFAAPPIVTGSEVSIGDSLGSNDGFGFILMIIAIVIILIVIAGVGAFAFMQYNKNSTPSFGSTKKTGGISSKIKDKVKKNNDKDLGKWKYKG